jgi:hypothetical protein
MAIIDDPVEDPQGLTQSAPTDPLLKVDDSAKHDLIGRAPTSETIRLENEANTVAPEDQRWYRTDADFLLGDSIKKSFTSGGNFAYELYKRGEREWLSPKPDPTFNADDFIRRNRAVIPQALEAQYHLAGSETEANLILSDMSDSLKKQEILARRGGFSTFVAQGIAGMVDLDTPLAVVSGGASSAFKGGILATKWGRIAASATFGGMEQAVAQTVALNAGTTGDWTSVPAAGLGGMVFGLAGGALKKETAEIHANERVHDVTKDFDEYVADGAPLAAADVRKETHLHDDPYGSRAAQDAEEFHQENIVIPEGQDKPTVVKLEDLGVHPDGIGSGEQTISTGSTMKDIQGENGGSIGARQLQAQGSTATIASSRVRDMITSARNWANRTGIAQEYNDKYTGIANNGALGDTVAKWASRFHDMIAASPMATDFDRMWRSGSVVAQRTAYDLFESASGIVRNNRSAAMLMELYRNQLGSVSEHYDFTRKLWNKEQGLSPLEALDPAHRKQFNREILTELQGRAYDAPGTDRGASPSIKAAADAIDAFHKKDIEIGQGRPGEGSIKGYENFQPYSGYFSQRWSGAAMENLIRNGGKTAKDISDAIAEHYVHQHGMTRENADIYASAVVNRARRNEQGLDTNLIGILQKDGSEFLADTLRANGVSTAEANALVQKLKGETAERSQQGHTKKRIDVDMRYTATNGINMMDLMDNDVAGILARRVRSTAGAAALARKGISSKADMNAVIDAILEEQQARGHSLPTGTSQFDKFNDLVDRDKHLTREHLEGMFSNFTGGPIAGGLSPFYANAKKLTNLVLLPQLGLTQMSELGAQISTVGLKRWFEHAGYAMRGNAANPTSPLAQELKHMGVMVPEEKYFRNDLNLDMERQGPGASWLSQEVTRKLNDAQHLMGYTSLYYQVRNFQQRVAVTSAADKIMRNMAGLANDLSAERAADIGLDPALYSRIQRKYAQPVAVNQHGKRPPVVEFVNGTLHKTNFDKWDPQDAEDFVLALNRHVNQTVQKAMAGESSVLFHKDGIASLFFHMKTFSLLAVEKQVLRNVRLQDGEALGTFLAGLTTAAAAYTAKQAINGNTQNLSLDKIARGAIGYSNMTGWLPMWVDPMAGMLGLEALKINEFGGSRGQAGDILSAPAALSAINGLAHLPAIAGHAVTGSLSNNDVRAMQTTPIIGKAYGVTALLNSLKTTN